jgi:hypothetical protein
MSHSASDHGRRRALLPAAVLLLTLCLLAGGVQASYTPGIQRYVAGDVLEIASANQTGQVVVAKVDTTTFPARYYTTYDVVRNAGRWEIPRYWHQESTVDEQNLVETLHPRRVGHVDPVLVIITDPTVTGGDMQYAGLSLAETLAGVVYPLEPAPGETGMSPLYVPGDILGGGTLVMSVDLENGPEPYYTTYDVVKSGDRWEIRKLWHGDFGIYESQLIGMGARRTAHADPHIVVVNDTTITGGDMTSHGLSMAELGTVGGYWVENWQDRPQPYEHARYVVGDVVGDDASPTRYIVGDVAVPANGFPANGHPLYTMYPVVRNGTGWAIPSYAHGDYLRIDALQVYDRGMHRMDHTDPHFAIVTDPAITAGDVYFLGLSLGEILGGTHGYPPEEPAGPFPAPYRPHAVPCRIEAEDYDVGGFSDTTPGNSGGAYRHDDVDIETAGGVTNVGWIRNGEYLTYTVTVAEAGAYDVIARVASPNSGRTMTLAVDDHYPMTLGVPNTGSFTTYANAVPPIVCWDPPGGFGSCDPVPVTLSAGTHVLKVSFQGDGQNLDWIELAPRGGSTPTPTPTPIPPTPNGTAGEPYPAPHLVPGRVEAEDYDVGGFADTTAANEGGAYRTDAVDIEVGGSNHNVGWIRAGESLTYSVDAAAAGTYSIGFRVANPGAARTVTVSVNGAARSLTVPATGSFRTWQTAALTGVNLNAGRNAVRIDTGTAASFNLDYLQFGQGGTPTPTVTTPTPAAGGASFTAAPVTAPKGSAVKFTLTPAPGKRVGAAWWSFDATAHMNTWNSRATSPTFYYPARGTFTPLVKITYTDGSTETVQRTGYVRAT